MPRRRLQSSCDCGEKDDERVSASTAAHLNNRHGTEAVLERFHTVDDLSPVCMGIATVDCALKTTEESWTGFLICGFTKN